MRQVANIDDAERKAFTSVFEDGIWEMYPGMLLLTLGLSTLSRDMGLAPTKWSERHYL